MIAWSACAISGRGERKYADHAHNVDHQARSALIDERDDRAAVNATSASCAPGMTAMPA